MTPTRQLERTSARASQGHARSTRGTRRAAPDWGTDGIFGTSDRATGREARFGRQSSRRDEHSGEGRTNATGRRGDARASLSMAWDGQDWVVPADRADATGIGPAETCQGGGKAVEIVLTADRPAPRDLAPACSEVDFFEADLAGDFSRETPDRPSLRDAARSGIEVLKATATSVPPVPLGRIAADERPRPRVATPLEVLPGASAGPATQWHAAEQEGDRATVVVRGRPDEFAGTRLDIAAVQRREELRGNAIERTFASHPERLAGWAVGLGFILILTAVSTG